MTQLVIGQDYLGNSNTNIWYPMINDRIEWNGEGKGTTLQLSEFLTTNITP